MSLISPNVQCIIKSDVGANTQKLGYRTGTARLFIKIAAEGRLGGRPLKVGTSE